MNKKREQADDDEKREIGEIVSSIGAAIDGKRIGHIIPALIYTLAMLHNKDVLSKQEYIANVAEDLDEWIDKLEIVDAEIEKENVQWLQ